MPGKHSMKWPLILTILTIGTVLFYVIFGELLQAVVFLVSLLSLYFGFVLLDYLPIKPKNENVNLIVIVTFPITLMYISYAILSFILTNSTESISEIFPFMIFTYLFSLGFAFAVNKL